VPPVRTLKTKASSSFAHFQVRPPVSCVLCARCRHAQPPQAAVADKTGQGCLDFSFHIWPLWGPQMLDNGRVRKLRRFRSRRSLLPFEIPSWAPACYGQSLTTLVPVSSAGVQRSAARLLATEPSAIGHRNFRDREPTPDVTEKTVQVRVSRHRAPLLHGLTAARGAGNGVYGPTVLVCSQAQAIDSSHSACRMSFIKRFARPAAKAAARFVKPVAAAVGAAVAYRCCACGHRRRGDTGSADEDEEIVAVRAPPSPPGACCTPLKQTSTTCEKARHSNCLQVSVGRKPRRHVLLQRNLGRETCCAC